MTDADGIDHPPIEGDYTEIEVGETDVKEIDPQTRALVLSGVAQPAGSLEVALLSKEAFEARLVALAEGVNRVHAIQRAMMRKDVDFGIIPGTKSPSLLKPGAEKLADFYNLRAAFKHTRTPGDGVTAPAIHYISQCDLHLGSLEGPVVAQGYGSASAWEKKYRYRGGGRICPNCGVGAIMRSKYPPRDDPGAAPGWYCNSRNGGCGANLPANADVGDEKPIENPDPHELDNTLLKISEKRAFIDAVLRACNASGLFTQDVGDNDGATLNQSDGGAVASGEPPRTATTPAPSSAAQPGGTTFEGQVAKAIDRVREKPAPDWADVPRGAQVAQAEIKFKVGNSNHTAILLSDLAYAAYEAEIKVDERIRTDGVLYLHEWEVGKPKMKQLHKVSRVEVQRDGAWHTVEALSGRQQLPLEGNATEVALHREPPGDEPPAGVVVEDAEPPDLGAALTGDVVDEIDGIDRRMSLEEMKKLDTADPVEALIGSTVDAVFILLSAEARKAGPADIAYAEFGDDQARYVVLVPPDDRDQFLSGPKPGDRVRIAATWQRSRNGAYLLLAGWETQK